MTAVGDRPGRRPDRTREADAAGTSGAPTRRLGFVSELDGVRGVAVLLVVVGHLLEVLVEERGWVRGTFLGVDLFFVLSGFLITALLLNDQAHSGRVRLGAFYRRRALRLLPALYVLLAVHVVWASTVEILGDERGTITRILLYVQNYDHTLRGAEGLGHLWSLSVEEQFYIVWPFAVMLVAGLRNRFSTSVGVITAAIVFVAARRAWMWGHGGFFLWMYMGTDTRADSLLVGALAAHLWVRGRVPKRVVGPLAWLGAALLAFCVWRLDFTRAFYYQGGLTLIAVGLACGLLAALDTDWSARPFLRLRPLRAVGRVSYGLYLWHLFVFTAVARHGADWPVLGRVAAGLAITAVLTVASFTVVERPFLRWKDRLEERAASSG